MSVSTIADRLRRPLVGVIAAVFALGVASSVLVDPDPSAVDARRAGAGAVGSPDVAADGVVGGPGSAVPVPGDPAAGGIDAVVVAPPDPGAPPLGPAAVPAAGVYRYEVQTTADGQSTVQEELREIEVLGGDRTAGTVQISARLAGESQVSVLDWSPAGAMVRSTRIESSGGSGQDCAWSPPFPELGSLGAGATWSLDSSCRTVVGGIDTGFRITGTGRVSGEAVLIVGEERVRVWQIERDRTTDISAELGAQSLTQQAREQGTLFLDPARGVVIRSDVTVTLTGARTGTSRRVSVLRPG